MHSELNPYDWLTPGYQLPPCKECHGQGCNHCRGTGRGAPVFSRTEAIRRSQEAVGRVPCFGIFGKSQREPGLAVTPFNCGEDDCPMHRQCIGLYLRRRFHVDRIREESIEHLSRVYLSARAIERRTPRWSPFQAEVAGLVQQWTDDIPQVAVLGAFSAGKSTLLNRLFERPLLPATRTPTTAVVTSIKYDKHSHGVLHYRASVRVTLLSQDARSPDPAAVRAMSAWLREPEHYGVRTIREIDEHGAVHSVKIDALLNDLNELEVDSHETALIEIGAAPRRDVASMWRSIGKRKTPQVARLARTFEVIFCKREPKDFDLASDSDATEFGRYLTEPSLALSVQRATCFLHDERLRPLSFLDTAGLCSPVGFHKDVTAELLQRRPDKILVVLDARRLDCPTNREALKVLGRFVTVADDYRQVTFILTFWDHALRTYMTEDNEPELNFNSDAERERAGKIFAGNKRKDLVRLLSSSVGVPCAREPVVFTLGLGPHAPHDMVKGLDLLWGHLHSDCSGWVGIEMWADRWRAACGLADRLLELHRKTISDIEEDKERALHATDLNAEAERNKKQIIQIKKATTRAQACLREVIKSQKQKMLVEVRSLDSKAKIVNYLESGYEKSANEALDRLQEESRRQKEIIIDLYPDARSLSIISLNRKLLGLDVSARDTAKSEVSGFLYGLKSIWDFLLGGVKELNEGNRTAAREILRGQVQNTIDILKDALAKWENHTERIIEQAVVEFTDRDESIAARKLDMAKYLNNLDRKLLFLSNCESPVRKLCIQMANFEDGLGKAKQRIVASRQIDCNATLFTEDGEMQLRKGREEDLFLLWPTNKSGWKWLEIKADGRATRFLPNMIGNRGIHVVFIEDDGKVRESYHPVIIPEGTHRFELRLSTLEGKFIVSKRFETRQEGHLWARANPPDVHHEDHLA